jgi:hypothetical protein
MKFVLMLTVLFYSIQGHAKLESFYCLSDDQVWNLSLVLDEEVAKTIDIKKNGKPFINLNSIVVNSYAFWLPGKGKTRFYEMELGGIKYLYLERRIINEIPSSSVEAEFLPTNNPVGFAQYANCKLQTL